MDRFAAHQREAHARAPQEAAEFAAVSAAYHARVAARAAATEG